MNETAPVHELEPVEQRMDDSEQLLLAEREPGVDGLLEVHPALVLHDHVGRAVGLEYAENSDNIGVFELCQRTCLAHEPLEPPIEYR